MPQVLENTYLGQTIIQVTAMDADSGVNARLAYRLRETDMDSFEVDPSTGAVRVKYSLDRERTPHFRFQIFAVDGGSPPRTGSAVILLTVADVNDESPTFAVDSFAFTVDENLAAGADVGVVIARDRDAPPFDAFSFALIGSGGGGSLSSADDAFAADRRTGRIRTTRPLDREEQAVYRLVIVVRDDNGAPGSATATITVTVVDVNDNAPRWVDDDNAAMTTATGDVGDDDGNFTVAVTTVVVSVKAMQGTVVYQLRTVDADIGDNGRVVYSMIERGRVISADNGNNDDDDEVHISSSMAAAALFDVDANSGTIAVRRDLKRIQLPDNYTVHATLTATDRGAPTPLRAPIRRIRFVVSRSETAIGAEPLGHHRGSSGYHRHGSVGGTTMLAVHVDNVVVVAALAATTGLVIVILVLAIACLVRRQRRLRRQGSGGSTQKYNCRIEALKAMTAKEAAEASASATSVFKEELSPLTGASGSVTTASCDGGVENGTKKPDILICSPRTTASGQPLSMATKNGGLATNSKVVTSAAVGRTKREKEDGHSSQQSLSYWSPRRNKYNKSTTAGSQVCNNLIIT